MTVIKGELNKVVVCGEDDFSLPIPRENCIIALAARWYYFCSILAYENDIFIHDKA